MTSHATFLELAAAALDFELSSNDRARLERHLAECAACARSASAYRPDGLLVASTKVPPLPERRAAQILDTAIRPEPGVSALRLLVVIALMSLLLVGGVIAGSRLLHSVPNPFVPPPIALESPGPSGSPTSPDATATPSPSPIAARLGDTWTLGQVPSTSDTISAVTSWGRGFVAVGISCPDYTTQSQGEGVVWTSQNGVTWTRAPSQEATTFGCWIAMSGPSAGMLDVAAGTPGIVIVGYATRTSPQPAVLLPTAWFSTDGVTWTRTTLENSSQLFRVNAVAWDGARFVAVGEDRDDAFSAEAIKTAHSRAAVWTSADGRTWTRVKAAALDAGGMVDTMEDPAAGGMTDIAAGAAGLVGVGSTCSATSRCTAAAWFSADGATWERAQVPAISGFLNAVVARGSGYVAVGTSTVLTSSDGRTWTTAAAPNASDLRAATVMGDRLFVVGLPGDGTAPAGTLLWASEDLRTWSPATEQGGVDPTKPGREIGTWHFAANGTTAVWIAYTDTSKGMKAWYSTASP